MRIAFAGTPEFAAVTLQALIDANNDGNSDTDIVAVYSQPDRPAGRGRKMTASPVKQLALQHDLLVLQPENLKTAAAQQEMAALDLDLLIVVAYGLLLPQAVLDIPTHGCINVHASLLPRWRGAAPIQRAIQAGDETTGVTIMQMEAGLDTGPMLAKTELTIADTETSGELHDRLADAGAASLLDVLSRLSAITPETQDDSQAVYAEKLSKAEAWIDWSQPSEVINRQIRAFNPWPVAQTVLDGKRLRIFSASFSEAQSAKPNTTTELPGTVLSDGVVATLNGTLVLGEIQLEGGKRMLASEFFRSRDLTGQQLGGQL